MVAARATTSNGLHSWDVVPDAGRGLPDGGYVATFTAVPENITDPLQTLPIYTNVFSKIGLVTLAVTVVMAIMVPWLNRMINTPSTEQ